MNGRERNRSLNRCLRYYYDYSKSSTTSYAKYRGSWTNRQLAE